VAGAEIRYAIGGFRVAAEAGRTGLARARRRAGTAVRQATGSPGAGEVTTVAGCGPTGTAARPYRGSRDTRA